MRTSSPPDARRSPLPQRVDLPESYRGTLVVLPSLSFPASELAKITAIERYEERLLYLLLHLADPETRVVYITSLPVDPAIVDYYLQFLPDPADARERLRLVSLGHFSGSGLARDLADDPDALATVRTAVDGDRDRAVLLPFNVTAAEHAVATALDVPLFAAHPDLVSLGSKTGSRRLARAAGVDVLPGAEDLWSPAAISGAVDDLRRQHPALDAVVVKLNNGFSGQGNAMVTWNGARADLADRDTVFCATGESWRSFTDKILAEGAIVEQLLRDRAASPSAQAWIAPDGAVRVVSTHDQVLGGPGGQVYLGCRYPADARYRAEIVEATRAVGQQLADGGVVGPFAIDFSVVGTGPPAIYLSEINLRLGGTTHPFGMARLVTDAHADPVAGMTTDDGPRVYIASDNLKEPALIGVSPAEVIARVRRAGLTFDPASRVGVTLHLLGAVTGHGKLGAVCIARTHDEAEQLAAALDAVLSG